MISWLSQYTTTTLMGDVVAGVTVGLMTVPQALAYSIIAGLPPNVSYGERIVQDLIIIKFLNLVNFGGSRRENS